MPSSTRPSRLALYSLTASAAAAGSASADVTTGSFDITFGRVAGERFFDNFTNEWNNFSDYRSHYVSFGDDLRFFFDAFQAGTYADASFTMSIWRSASTFDIAYFNNNLYTSFSVGSSVPMANMQDAGALWSSPTDPTANVRNQIFWTYTTSNSDLATWTNPNATGTKFINFHIELDADDIYGWVQLDWDITDANDWSLTVSNWAHTSDGPLAAGSTGAPAVPGLGGLAALAVGAAGVRGRRQRIAG